LDRCALPLTGRQHRQGRHATAYQSQPTRSGSGPGFRFSPRSNQPVTAQTFKDSIERTLTPRMHGPAAQYVADVVGARSYTAGKASHVAGVVASGDTLTIRLLAPAPDFLSRIAWPAFCAVPSNTPKGARLIPSSGPYYVASYTPGQRVVWFATRTTTAAVHTASRDRACGRDLHQARVRGKRGRHRRLHGFVVVFLHHDRRARLATRRPLRARQRRGRARKAHCWIHESPAVSPLSSRNVGFSFIVTSRRSSSQPAMSGSVG
jgi:hypothetical protein